MLTGRPIESSVLGMTGRGILADNSYCGGGNNLSITYAGNRQYPNISMHSDLIMGERSQSSFQNTIKNYENKIVP